MIQIASRPPVQLEEAVTGGSVTTFMPFKSLRQLKAALFEQGIGIIELASNAEHATNVRKSPDALTAADFDWLTEHAVHEQRRILIHLNLSRLTPASAESTV